MKSPGQAELSEAKQFHWDILFQRENVCKVAIETYSLPVWAGTWKIMNFPFRQEKKDWDHIWTDYQQNLTNNFDQIQQLEEEVGIITMTVVLLISALYGLARCYMSTESDKHLLIFVLPLLNHQTG